MLAWRLTGASNQPLASQSFPLLCAALSPRLTTHKILPYLENHAGIDPLYPGFSPGAHPQKSPLYALRF